MVKCDFSGYATRNDLTCGDGRVIRKDAFKNNNGQKIPLVWNHEHNDPNAVLGHAVLENREDGVYAYGTFNDTEQGQMAKQLVQNGDVSSLSIWANQLKQIGKDVIHGNIRELSLVLAGSNPGAYVDFVMSHSEDGGDELEACWYENIMLHHSADSDGSASVNNGEKRGEKQMSDSNSQENSSEQKKEKSIQEVIDSMNEEATIAMENFSKEPDLNDLAHSIVDAFDGDCAYIANCLPDILKEYEKPKRKIIIDKVMVCLTGCTLEALLKKEG